MYRRAMLSLLTNLVKFMLSLDYCVMTNNCVSISIFTTTCMLNFVDFDDYIIVVKHRKVSGTFSYMINVSSRCMNVFIHNVTYLYL